MAANRCERCGFELITCCMCQSCRTVSARRLDCNCASPQISANQAAWISRVNSKLITPIVTPQAHCSPRKASPTTTNTHAHTVIITSSARIVKRGSNIDANSPAKENEWEKSGRPMLVPFQRIVPYCDNGAKPSGDGSSLLDVRKSRCFIG
jgi:hypothetical protein